MDFGTLLSASIILFTGLAFGKLMTLFRLPNVTGYLLGGLIIGPSVLGILSVDSVETLGIISQVALAFIAFTIGLSFKRAYFKRVGWAPIVIAVFEATTAVLLVQISLLIAGFELPLAILLGAIAAATAPAVTIMVIEQYKAKGPVTDMLLSVVAVDDAIGIILFGFAATITQTLVNPNASTNVVLSLLNPFIDIIFALIIGIIVGLLMKYVLKIFTTRNSRLTALFAGVFLCTGLSITFGVSDLLANMTFGLVLTNISLEAQVMDEMTEYITPPIYMMFFVLSGAGLQLSIIPTVGLLGITYIVLRVVGKMLGAYLGARVMKTPVSVRKYLGPMLIPQAGVAIGLTTVAQQLLPTYAAEITAVVLVGTLIYEFIGPVITKISLHKAGETNAK
ncbi:cation:proton antiporter [Amphibacillus sp. Q70]|uniref:cation:proton antiporter n=1 Tax=Amphibacillus sp. Q70 TaxID=3453416 RepID=UPI003F83A160